jgi:hypothetical protein
MSDDDTSQQPQSKRQRTTHDSRSVDTSSSMSIYDSGHDQGPQGNPYPPPTESTVAAAAVAVQGVVMQKQKQVSPRNRAKIDMSPHASHAADLHHQTQKAPPRSMALAAMAAVMMSTDASSSSSPPGPEMDPSLTAATEGSGSGSSVGGSHHALSTGVPRLPPILQVEKQQVTTSATQMASASRRRNEAHFVCPVPGCGSTFTRRFNLRGVSLGVLGFVLARTQGLVSFSRSSSFSHGRATVCMPRVQERICTSA